VALPEPAAPAAGAACANTDCEAIIKTEANKAEVILDFMDTLSKYLTDPSFEFNTTMFTDNQNSIAGRFFYHITPCASRR
jgi:GTPase Era involved in 16S rRNA processing